MATTVRKHWWSDDEWLVVAYHAREHLAAGATKLQALQRANAKLPKDRRATDKALLQKSHSRGLPNAIERLAAVNPEQLVALGLQPVYAPPSTTPYIPRGSSRLPAEAEYGTKGVGKGHGKMVRWTERETALISRRVMSWQAAGSDAGVGRLITEAQEIELPPERRRSRRSIQVMWKALSKLLKQAAKEHANLIADVPYDPCQRVYAPPKVTTAAIPPAESRPVAPMPPAAAPTPAPIPQSSPTEPSRPVSAASAAHEAARVFGINLANALVPMVEHMLDAHEQHVLARLAEQQRVHGEKLAADMSRLLLEGLDRMLGGGGIAPPEQQAVPENFTPLAADEPGPKRMRVDVVGFEHGYKKILLQGHLNGHADHVDLNFIHPDKWSTYKPDAEREVIVMRGRVPHGLSYKIKAACPNAHWVGRTVTDVAQAINKLIAAQSA